MKVIREVQLPDGRECTETEEVVQVGPEAQSIFSYSVDVSRLEKDYWGDVKGRKVIG